MYSLQLRVANQLLQQRAEIALNDLASDCQKQDLTLPCTFSFQLTVSQGSGFLFWNCAANSVLSIDIGTEDKLQCLGEWSAGRSKSHKVDLASIRSKIDEIEFDQSEVLHVRVSGHGELHCVGFQQKASECSSEIASHGRSTQRTLTTAKPGLMSASSDFCWVSRRSQRLLPGIGSRVCGPTSLSTLLVQSGRIVSTDAFALRCYDYTANIFGNWSFLIAGASEFGEFALGLWLDSIEQLESLLKKGCRVVVSQRFDDRQLAGSPLPKTSGHLLIVRQVLEHWIAVLDPAAHGREGQEVARNYDRQQFSESWRGFAIVLLPNA